MILLYTAKSLGHSFPIGTCEMQYTGIICLQVGVSAYYVIAYYLIDWKKVLTATLLK